MRNNWDTSFFAFVCVSNICFLNFWCRHPYAFNHYFSYRKSSISKLSYHFPLYSTEIYCNILLYLFRILRKGCGECKASCSNTVVIDDVGALMTSRFVDFFVSFSRMSSPNANGQSELPITQVPFPWWRNNKLLYRLYNFFELFISMQKSREHVFKSFPAYTCQRKETNVPI